MLKQSCFVLMPFGIKTDPNNAERKIDFNKVYRDLIKPAIEAANLIPIRADEEAIGGVIHKAMFDRLLLCRYAIADLSFGNANVFYELGIRHAYKKCVTMHIREVDTRLPFDLSMVRMLGYNITEGGDIENLEATKGEITATLNLAQKKDHTDSPIFGLIPDLKEPKINILSEVFEAEEQEANEVKLALEDIKIEFDVQISSSADKEKKKEIAQIACDKVKALEKTIDNWEHLSVVANFLYIYRNIQAFNEMAEFIEQLPNHIKDMTLVREQYGIALGRLGKTNKANYTKAERLLNDLIKERGASSETYGILGGIYKQQFDSLREEHGLLALTSRSFLFKAIETYKKGFFTNPMEYYPGINALTLMTIMMTIKGTKDPDFDEILHLVSFTVKKQIEAQNESEEYWLFATQLELAFLNQDRDLASETLGTIRRLNQTGFKVDTTLKNLQLIIDNHKSQNKLSDWEIPLKEMLSRWGGQNN